MAWSLLRIFPKELLNRISPKIIEEFYHRKPSGKGGSKVGGSGGGAEEAKDKDKSKDKGDKLVDV